MPGSQTQTAHPYAGRPCRECGTRPADGRMHDGTPIPICQGCKDAQDGLLATRVRHEAQLLRLVEDTVLSGVGVRNDEDPEANARELETESAVGAAVARFVRESAPAS